MIHRFVIEGRLPSLNQMIGYRGRPWWMNRRVKQDAMRLVKSTLMIGGAPVFKSPVKIKFVWVEANGRRDRDNVTGGGAKIILDAMKEMGMICDDSRKWVVDIQNDTTQIDAKRPRIEIWIEEVDCV